MPDTPKRRGFSTLPEKSNTDAISLEEFRVIVGDGWGGDDGADLGEEIVEIVRLLDGVDDAGFQHFGATRGREIAAGHDGADAGAALLHFQDSFAAAAPRQADRADYRSGLVAIPFQPG